MAAARLSADVPAPVTDPSDRVVLDIAPLGCVEAVTGAALVKVRRTAVDINLVSLEGEGDVVVTEATPVEEFYGALLVAELV